MGAFSFKIYSQKHIISTEFYVEFMCFWDNVLVPQIEIDGSKQKIKKHYT